MEVYLLGQFQVTYRGELLTSLNHTRLQELLAYLLLQQGRPVSRQQIAYLFWPDSAEEQARTNLRNLLYRLKKALPTSESFLLIDETCVQWNSTMPYSLDVAQFVEVSHRAATAQKQQRIALLAQAVNLYGGDLLPECYSDWLLAERERLRQTYLSTLTRLAELYTDQRDYKKAIQTVQDLLRLDTLNENAYAWLMRLYAMEGNRGEALHIYHLCSQVLRCELGVDPGPAVRSLYNQLLQTATLRIQPAPATTLIARQSEWEELTRRWSDLLHGQQTLCTVLILGESGIGKTHLAQTFVDWVRRQGYRASTAICYESGRDLAYAPVATWLAGLYQQDGRLFDKLAPIWRGEISRLLPEFRNHNLKQDLPGSLSEKWQLLPFYEALSHFIGALPGPLLLFLDDIHWCDQETLAWLAYLQTKPLESKVILIATARSEALTAGHPALELFEKSNQQDALMELQHLDEIGTRELAEQLLSEPVEPDMAQLIYLQSEGNPLFVTEMVRSGLNQYANGSGPLPERIRAVIMWRLNQLSPSARQVLELASIIGRSFSYELLRAANRLDEQSLVDALDECWRQRILREQNNQSYDFNHEMLRQVVYDGISQTRRSLWHELAAQALERIYASNPDQVAEQIANHLEQAGKTSRAVLFYERAAQAARRLYALPQARHLLEKALELMSPSAHSDRFATRVLEQLGQVMLISGQYQASRKNLMAAFQGLDPNDSIGRARIKRLEAQTWSAQLRYAEAGAAINSALNELGEGVPAGLESDWRQEWLEIRLQQLDYFYFNNQPDEMQAICDLFHGYLQQFGTPGQQAEYCTLLGMLNNRRLRYRVTPETMEIARRGLELAEQIGDPLLISRKCFGLGFNTLWYGDRPAAISLLKQALAHAEKLGATFCQNQALAYLAIAYRMDGDMESVRQLAERGLALAEAEHHPTYQGTALANLAWLAYRNGDLERAEKLAQNALELWQSEVNYPIAWLANFPLAALALQREDIPSACARLTAILASPQQRLPETMETCLRRVSISPVRETIYQVIETAGQMGYL